MDRLASLPQRSWGRWPKAGGGADVVSGLRTPRRLPSAPSGHLPTAWGGNSREFLREPDLRCWQLDAEPLLVGCGEVVEVDAHHGFLVDGVDPVQPDRVARPHRGGVGVRHPAIAAIDVAVGEL